MLVRMLNNSVEKISTIKAMTELRSVVNGKVYRKVLTGGDKPNMISMDVGFSEGQIGNLTSEQVASLIDKAFNEGKLDLPKEVGGNYVVVFAEKDIPQDRVYTLLHDCNCEDPFGIYQNQNVQTPSPISFGDEDTEYDEYEDDDDNWEEV